MHQAAQNETAHSQEAFRRWPGRGFVLRSALIVVAVGIFLGLLGPYGSYLNPGLVARILYWSCCALMGLGLYAGPVLLMRRLGVIWHGPKFWVGMTGLVMVLSLLQTLITRDLALSVWPDLSSRLPGWGQWYGQVLLIAWPSVVLVTLALRYRNRSAAIAEETVGQGVPALVGNETAPIRLADDYPRPETIFALQMEDHYIRCHQREGSRLVYGIFREALLRQSGCAGLQVHRSWWVARKAVAGWEGTPRALRLILINGDRVPVSRAHVAKLREAGWLDTL